MDRKVMTLNDWQQRWVDKLTGWHRDTPHELLIKHFDEFVKDVKPGAKILVPLCGKSLDIKWLSDHNFVVHGVEYEQIAIEEFFKENSLTYTKSSLSADINVFKAENGKIQIFQGDFFKFNEAASGCKYDLIWDRASFVAINVEDREKYVQLLRSLLVPGGKILMATMDYDPDLWKGPPHFVTLEDVEKHYGKYFGMKYLDTMDLSEEKNFKDKNLPITENLHLLTLKK